MEIKGIIPAMVTPMDENQKVDVEATHRHIDFLISKGVHGLFILGTNGEFHVLNKQEKIDFAKIVVDYTQGRVPVYAGAGACGTQDAIELAQGLESVGVDALSVITPYLIKVSQNELVDHYKMVANAVKIPIILYNIPANTGINIDPETVAQLIDVPNILGIKDSSGNMENTQGYIDLGKDHDFSVLVGSDSKILEGLKRGAVGSVASTANAIPEHIVGIYDAFHANEIEKAEQMQKDVDYIRAVGKLATVPSMIKRCVTVRGNNVGEARFPVSAVGSKFDQEIKEMFAEYGIQ
ncbi:4-hydroxy-tetrahydrodipicolinate synthase [Erysipelothrix inopinata]|uniref:4-hydroxy-tetrahydrodipicolinate synthase n=1 Tax=Erysipelothrix inopinata TaxID=225084 RepID=A0A7G9S0N0_9FIRM|nr:4-hydroxy-tetrahydrodipicolinate synthase [Erysipelothrix inopinata]QNN61405.1 4-hydroxy-tetrahydrodipicolinate synthase [Erysipelothrix inopinata]